MGDTDLVASNIISGKDIFGVQGTAEIRKFASGATPSNGGGVFTCLDGSTESKNSLTITGLSFKPILIIAKWKQSGVDNNTTTVYEEVGGASYGKTVTMYTASTTFGNSVAQYKGDVTPVNIVNGSFTIPVSSTTGENITWIAMG